LLPRQIERERQSGDRDDKIRQCVQSPLTGPGPLPGIGEWKQIGNRPLIMIRPASTDQVTKQVQMETEECKDCCLPSLRCKRKSDDHHYQAEGNIVPENMMIVRPPSKRPLRTPSQNLNNNSGAVEIRDDPGDGHDSALATGQVGRVGRQPADQEVVTGLMSAFSLPLLTLAFGESFCNLAAVRGSS
jgi:hypothetical protein